MANPEHVAKLKEGGAKAWNEWRETSDEKPDLSGVELRGISLDDYNLRSADFSGATLDRVTFTLSICVGCSFSRAGLITVMF